MSPDGAWPAFAPAGYGRSHRRLDAFAKEKAGFRARYVGDGDATLLATKDARGLDIDAVTSLPPGVFAQRVVFTVLRVPFAARIAFGTMDPFEVGGPGLRVWLGKDSALHISRPSTASRLSPLEPAFTEIARTPHGADEPIVVELRHREGVGSCRLTFKDFTSQLSMEPSRHGFDVPENAVTLAPETRGDAPGLVVTLLLADAGPRTAASPTPGIYRNRIRVDTVMAPLR
jgi:hypothetical protein